MKLAGIDLAWHCNKNPTAIAIGNLIDGVLDVRLVEASILTVECILHKLHTIEGLTGVAIDASLIIPNKTGQRICENEIATHYGARGASCHATNLTLYPKSASVELSQGLDDMGFKHLGMPKWQIECYPHPAIIEIFGLSRRLAYKKGSVSEKKSGQKQLGNLIKRLATSHILPMRFHGDVHNYLDETIIESLAGKSLKSNEDALDAIICLYIAGLYAIQAKGRTFGNINDGYIWVPQIETLSAPRD